MRIIVTAVLASTWVLLAGCPQDTGHSGEAADGRAEPNATSPELERAKELLKARPPTDDFVDPGVAAPNPPDDAGAKSPPGPETGTGVRVLQGEAHERALEKMREMEEKRRETEGDQPPQPLSRGDH